MKALCLSEELLLPECGVKEVVAASQLAAVRQDIRPLVKDTMSDSCAEELEKESDGDNQLTGDNNEERISKNGS